MAPERPRSQRSSDQGQKQASESELGKLSQVDEAENLNQQDIEAEQIEGDLKSQALSCLDSLQIIFQGQDIIDTESISDKAVYRSLIKNLEDLSPKFELKFKKQLSLDKFG